MNINVITNAINSNDFTEFKKSLREDLENTLNKKILKQEDIAMAKNYNKFSQYVKNIVEVALVTIQPLAHRHRKALLVIEYLVLSAFHDRFRAILPEHDRRGAVKDDPIDEGHVDSFVVLLQWLKPESHPQHVSVFLISVYFDLDIHHCSTSLYPSTSASKT